MMRSFLVLRVRFRKLMPVEFGESPDLKLQSGGNVEHPENKRREGLFFTQAPGILLKAGFRDRVRHRGTVSISLTDTFCVLDDIICNQFDITCVLGIHVFGYKCLLFPAIHRSLLINHKLDIEVNYGSLHHVAIHVFRRYLTRETAI